MDIKSLIINQLPNGLGDIVEKTGVDKETIEKIMDSGAGEIVKNGSKTEGSLFENIEEEVVSEAVAQKSGVDKGTVSKVVAVALPYIKKHIDGEELTKIIKGFSDGFGMDDVQNIAGAIMNDDSKSGRKGNSKKGGFLGNILGGLFGGK